mgnify:CR=1 FL=1
MIICVDMRTTLNKSLCGLPRVKHRHRHHQSNKSSTYQKNQMIIESFISNTCLESFQSRLGIHQSPLFLVGFCQFSNIIKNCSSKAEGPCCSAWLDGPVNTPATAAAPGLISSSEDASSSPSSSAVALVLRRSCSRSCRQLFLGARWTRIISSPFLSPYVLRYGRGRRFFLRTRREFVRSEGGPR